MTVCHSITFNRQSDGAWFWRCDHQGGKGPTFQDAVDGVLEHQEVAPNGLRLPCGCHIVPEHTSGQRRMWCSCGMSWRISASHDRRTRYTAVGLDRVENGTEH